MKTFETYCPICDEQIAAKVLEKPETLLVKGEPVEYTATVLVCPTCGEDIGDSRIGQTNIENAYAVYCRKHGLVTKADVADLRRRTGLSVREFSRYLGFGEQTAARYEMGSIPDMLHSNIMRMASSADGAQVLLDLNSCNMSDSSVRRIESYIYRLERGLEPSDLWFSLNRDGRRENAQNEFNGYRQIDRTRVGALVAILADRCKNLFKTKLQKAMFFCDFYAYEKNGRALTGMTYAHASFGPVMEGYEMWLKKLEADGVVKVVPHGDWGEIVIATNTEESVFSEDELRMIYDVCDFVNTFGSAREISDYSHKLSAWKETESGKPISYQACKHEVMTAVESRLKSRR